jgi:LAGLIDADG endonuclease
MEVSQNNKDCFILSCIQEYFNTGKVYYEKRGMVKFRLVIKKDIINIIIPHFTKHPLLGFKSLQYLI